VFYLPDAQHWNAAVARLRSAGYEPVASFNPYWDRKGKTFETRWVSHSLAERHLGTLRADGIGANAAASPGRLHLPLAALTRHV
jgi:hypothetical protein